MIDEITFSDVCSPEEFRKENPHLFDHPGRPKLEYLLRTRHINGLSECGAVIEPVQCRPLIVKPKFLEWMLNRTSAS